MADLRIFSYLPNPRIWKATIAARLTGVEIEIRGAKPAELPDWLWDFDAHPLTEADRADTTARAAHTGFDGNLIKTDAFLAANPFGTVPVAFSPDGTVGIFESNAIMRAVARIGADAFPLYGAGPYEAARIDAFLDVSLVFARTSQIYLLALAGDRLAPEVRETTRAAFETYMAGIEQALAPDRPYLVGDGVTLADICFAAELTQISRERGSIAKLGSDGVEPIFGAAAYDEYPRATAHFDRLCRHPAFAPDIQPFLEKIAQAAARKR
ncbi:MAG TPA: glutathione S-transferase family protein [Alphaproteobacteria bacterium]|nr:glutathione S-transferase family protein [Alphaproteobacteria bacterium]